MNDKITELRALAINHKDAAFEAALVRIAVLDAEIKKLRGVAEQAFDCIRGETPEDMSVEDARDDTLEKLRAMTRAGRAMTRAVDAETRELMADAALPAEPDPRLAAVAAWRDDWVGTETAGVTAIHSLLSELLTRVAALERGR